MSIDGQAHLTKSLFRSNIALLRHLVVLEPPLYCLDIVQVITKTENIHYKGQCRKQTYIHFMGHYSASQDHQYCLLSDT